MAFKKVEKPKSAWLEVRLTPEDKEAIKQRADDCNLSMSDFLVRAALSKQTRTRPHIQVIQQLMALGEIVRETYHSQQPRSADELQPVLEAIVRAIDNIGSRGNA